MRATVRCTSCRDRILREDASGDGWVLGPDGPLCPRHADCTALSAFVTDLDGDRTYESLGIAMTVRRHSNLFLDGE